MMRFKTVLVTGSNRGLGAELVSVFSYHDYNVITHSRKESVDTDTLHVCGDLQDYETIKQLANDASITSVDVIINNAGIYYNNSILDCTDEKIDEILNVNLTVPIKLIKAIWPVFKAKRSGLIININSIAGKQGGKNESIYCASKHGLRGFSESLKFEASEHNIKILDVYLGAMATDMTKTRPDRENLIKPFEAANTIFSLADADESLRISEITILRSQY